MTRPPLSTNTGGSVGHRGSRVSDALIVPEAVRANWNLTVIAMTELAADFVRES